MRISTTAISGDTPSIVYQAETDNNTRMLLPVGYKHVGFHWKNSLLPKIHTMIRELFNGMTRAYSVMGESNV